MKYTLLAAVAAFCVMPAAHAARVTNLDTVPHVVTFEQAGDVLRQHIEPGETVYFPHYDGLISLEGAPGAVSPVTSDGLLQGVVGTTRGSRIPAGPRDDFVIWEGGKLALQRRQKKAMGQ